MRLLAGLIHLFLLEFIVNRPYDFLVDADYMKRWWVIPRNKKFNIYYHYFFGSDADTMHDHPWWSISFILRGSYIEHTLKGDFVRKAGSITFRKATDLHWIELEKPVYTLFITGPKVRSWGFQCESGWVHWKEYVFNRGANRHANGCGEY